MEFLAAALLGADGAEAVRPFMHQPFFEVQILQWVFQPTPWKLIGYGGTLLFAGRWFVQWWASRKARRVTMPRLFWYMSVAGSLMTLSYFIWGKNDSVGILAYLFPSFVACYNLYLEFRGERERKQGAEDPTLHPEKHNPVAKEAVPRGGDAVTPMTKLKLRKR